MQDMMLSGPPRLLRYVMYCNKLVVQDPIQKYNYRPDRNHFSRKILYALVPAPVDDLVGGDSSFGLAAAGAAGVA